MANSLLLQNKPECYGSIKRNVVDPKCMRCKVFNYCRQRRHQKIVTPAKFRKKWEK